MHDVFKVRWRFWFAMPTALVLSGCTVLQVVGALARIRETNIGFYSSPTTTPIVGGFRIVMHPLNDNAFRSQTAFVVCFLGPSVTTQTAMTISLKPSEIVLVGADGRRLHPQAYAENRCGDAVEFKAVSPGVEARVSRPSREVWVFPSIALRFDTATIDPENEFSLELHSIDIDGESREVPIIHFKKDRGDKVISR